MCRHILVVGFRTWPKLACSLLTVGMTNVFMCWSPNYAIQKKKVYYQYNESVHRKEQQLATIITMMQYEMLTLFMLSFAKRRIRPPNAQQQVSNSNQFGSDF